MHGGVKVYRGRARGAREYLDQYCPRVGDYYLAEPGAYARWYTVDADRHVIELARMDGNAYEAWVAGVDPDTAEPQGRLRHDAHRRGSWRDDEWPEVLVPDRRAAPRYGRRLRRGTGLRGGADHRLARAARHRTRRAPRPAGRDGGRDIGGGDGAARLYPHRVGEITQLVPYVGAFSKRAAQIERKLARYEKACRVEHPGEEPWRTSA